MNWVTTHARKNRKAFGEDGLKCVAIELAFGSQNDPVTSETYCKIERDEYVVVLADVEDEFGKAMMDSVQNILKSGEADELAPTDSEQDGGHG